MRSNRVITAMYSLSTHTKLVALATLSTIALAVTPSVANAQIGFESFSTSVSNTQAGAHADVSTSFKFATDQLGNPAEQAKDVTVDLPSGVVGNPQAIPKCTDRDFQDYNCSSASQVGVLNATFNTTPGEQTTLTHQAPLGVTLTTAVSPSNKPTIQVSSTAGIKVGDYLQIGNGPLSETLIVSEVDAPHTIVFGYDGDTMNNSHAAGSPVGDDTIVVVSTSGFEGFDGGNNIVVGSGATAEHDTVAWAPSDSTHLILSHPLRIAHARNEPVFGLASSATVPIPVFNLQPNAGHVATLGATFTVANIIINIDVRNDGTYGLRASLSDISNLLTLDGSDLTLWGVPGDASHNALRCSQFLQCGNAGGGTAAFMTNPTNCPGAPLTTTISADSWQNPGQSATASAQQAPPTNCQALSFSPTISVSPNSSQADTPSGYDVDLGVPQNPDPFGIATPDVQNVSVTLPAGTAINPAAANGLQGCSDAQFDGGACPDASKVGNVSINTPLLPDPLTGSIWIGAPEGAQTYRLFMIASADNVTIKLSGVINPDPGSGQLTAVFNNNPQLPFSDLHLHFFGGPLGVLSNPEGCGAFTASSDIAPWGSPQSANAQPSSSYNITGCSPGQFSPSFSAGTTNPAAGQFSAFSLTFGRSDADQELSSLSATLPPGLFAKIAGVPLCPDADASAGTCSSASQVGTATVGAGAGTHPLFLSGRVYLTGGYKGGAYGLSTVVPAVAGPYNFGTVVVRQSLQIDPNDAHVTAVSDPFPTILQGTPLRIKTINLTLDRPNFIINPTSCAPLSIGARIFSVNGAAASVSSRFQVGDCGSLQFAPQLKINLSGKGQTTDGKHPTLTATLTAPSSGQANIQSARVRLPLSLALDPTNTETVCSVAAAAAINCPSNTIVGTSSAVSPLLPDPLSGNVYLVQGIRTNSKGQQIKTLPSLLVPLRGDIALNLRAQTSVDGAGRLITTFNAIPDAAVSNFVLTINGGKKGILVVTHNKNLCKAAQNGQYTLGSYSGVSNTNGVSLGTPCAKKKKKHSTHKKSTHRQSTKRARSNK